MILWEEGECISITCSKNDVVDSGDLLYALGIGQTGYQLTLPDNNGTETYGVVRELYFRLSDTIAGIRRQETCNFGDNEDVVVRNAFLEYGGPGAIYGAKDEGC